MVTQGLERRIQDEINGLDLSHIPFVVSDRSRDGKSLFEIGLKSLTPIANQKILSEGEQRALALACFLGEVAADTEKHGLIIDDPVSSLDHIRIRRVATRLVAEAAKGRQVVIFTHNLLFFNEVVEAAGRHDPQVPLVKRFITKSESQGFGLISESDEPWIAMTVSKRINMLQQRLATFKNINDFDTEDWRRKVKDFYTDLRETWERLVEEVLLGKVVERFNTDVRTQSLAGVAVEDDDYHIVYWAMKRASERSGHDMSAARAIPTPSLEDMKKDLAELDAYRTKAQARRGEAEKRRRKLEKPPVPEVA
jgi:AAA domain